MTTIIADRHPAENACCIHKTEHASNPAVEHPCEAEREQGMFPPKARAPHARAKKPQVQGSLRRDERITTSGGHHYRAGMPAIAGGCSEPAANGSGVMSYDTDPAPLVLLDHGEVWTTSFMIAEKFSKRHKDVLRAIEKKPCSAKFRQRNFAPAEYLDEQGKPRRMYRLTRDGFSLVVMGFTGESAVAWQERFIGAFSQMERELRRLASIRTLPDWQEARLLGKQDRRDLTDAVQALCKRAHDRGDSTTPLAKWAMSATKVVASVLFDCNGEHITAIRDRLTARQLRRLAMAEEIYAQAIECCLETDLHHKAINVQAKVAAQVFANSMGGREVPGVDLRPRRSLTQQSVYAGC